MGTEWSPCELAWGPTQSAFVVLTHVYLFSCSLTNRCRDEKYTRKRACVCGCERMKMVSLCASLVSLRTTEGGSKLFLILFVFVFVYSLANRYQDEKYTRKRACVCVCGRIIFLWPTNLVSLRTMEGGSQVASIWSTPTSSAKAPPHSTPTTTPATPAHLV